MINPFISYLGAAASLQNARLKTLKPATWQSIVLIFIGVEVDLLAASYDLLNPSDPPSTPAITAVGSA
ncbi:hypothetical protein [Pseudomonas sp.]|uniref:hypothetical protein n=1 Tax=Pseudomonas sp. TaxID=306 RepID=UPI00257F318C|nr:hypothetical protein [Pseudomonas sp.]